MTCGIVAIHVPLISEWQEEVLVRTPNYIEDPLFRRPVIFLREEKEMREGD